MEPEPEIASCGHYIEHDNECHEVGIKEERERILKVARTWISELQGHTSKCDCEKKAEILQNFIDHPDFRGEK